MTDSNLMDADCIHGNVWHECDVCDPCPPAGHLWCGCGDSFVPEQHGATTEQCANCEVADWAAMSNTEDVT